LPVDLVVVTQAAKIVLLRCIFRGILRMRVNVFWTIKLWSHVRPVTIRVRFTCILQLVLESYTVIATVMEFLSLQ